MTTKELIERLHQMPQDMDVTVGYEYVIAVERLNITINHEKFQFVSIFADRDEHESYAPFEPI